MKHHIILFALGALSFLDFAPFFWFSFYSVSIYYLGKIYLYETMKPKRLAWLTFCLYFGHFCGGLHWLIFPFKVVGLGEFGPLGVIGLSFGLAIIQTFIMILSLTLPFKTAEGRFIKFILGIVVAEFVRSYIFTGFPWNMTAHMWSWQPVIESASWLGIFGLSLATLLILNFFYELHKYFHLACCGIIALLICLHFMFNTKETINSNIPINVRLVQPSIAQSEKWNREKFWDNIELIKALSMLPAEKPIHLTIWPESSVSADIHQNKNACSYIVEGKLPESSLILGSIRMQEGKLYNTLVYFDKQGQLKDTYDKIHLTPFGEYMPFKRFIPFKKFTEGTTDYTPGNVKNLIKLSDQETLIPLICYEAVFPTKPSQENQKPICIVNITNDAWFGTSVGPYQHLHLVRFRAIEMGIPIVRSANNGISAVIDSKGRIISKLGMNAVGIVDETLPASLKKATIYARFGNLVFVCLVGIILLLGLVFEFRARPRE